MQLTQMAQMSCMIQNLNGVMVLSQLTRLQISDSQETAHAQCTTDLRLKSTKNAVAVRMFTVIGEERTFFGITIINKPGKSPLYFW